MNQLELIRALRAIVGEPYVQRFAVGFGIHRDGLHAELAAGADYS